MCSSDLRRHVPRTEAQLPEPIGVGRTDGFWELGLRPWDMAAAMVVVVEGGGRITNRAGAPPQVHERQLVATNGRIHDAMLEVL